MSISDSVNLKSIMQTLIIVLLIMVLAMLVLRAFKVMLNVRWIAAVDIWSLGAIMSFYGVHQ